MIYDTLCNIDDLLWDTPFLVMLIVCGIYLTIRSGFFSFLHFGHVLKNTFGSLFDNSQHEKAKGRISPFEAMCVAIGGTVGTGNIAGVAAAIATGGPGAVFWMWIWALVGMTIKSVEVTLACYYRLKDHEGRFFGGPTYYMERGLVKEKGYKWGWILIIGFAAGMLIQYLGGSQAYTISEALYNTFGLNQIAFVLVYSVFLIYIIWKGVPRIATIASKMVPFMSVLYLLGGLILIIVNIDVLPSVLASIFKGAFTPIAAGGGTAGYAVKTAVSKGLSRSMNSNEAGQGTSPMIHASANTEHPVRQGLWGAFEVFVDTLIVCSITALGILCTGVISTGQTSTGLTIEAFQSVFGTAGAIFIGVICFLFGLTTTAGWFTYYTSIVHHILRNHEALANKIDQVLKICYPIPNIVIVVMIVVTGSGPDMFWVITDISLVIPIFFNIISLVLMGGKYKELLKDYKARYLGIGTVDPNFKIFYEEK